MSTIGRDVKLRAGLAVLVILICVMAWAFQPGAQTANETRLIGFEGTPSEGFARAAGPRAFQFPRDDGPHNEFQTEWWYFTGNLSAADGRIFGYQLTFFRRALEPEAQRVKRASNWAAEQIYLAHFTLSDVRTGQFHYTERLERGSAGLAGAVGEPGFQVWLGDWKVNQTADRRYQLEAAQKGVELTLELNDLKGPILQGDQGYSQKGVDAGNASFYSSRTRLESSGTVSLDGQEFVVNGMSWMDHEFSTSALAPDQVGWDWFALHLSDGSELMVYTIRKADGSADRLSSGLLIYPDGRTRRLAWEEFAIDVGATWISPHSGAVYPAEWRVQVPSERINLKIKPRLADQELRVYFTYWEGAVEVSGTRNQIPVVGAGYVELTGYAETMQGRF